jgi:hypothetical protein
VYKLSSKDEQHNLNHFRLLHDSILHPLEHPGNASIQPCSLAGIDDMRGSENSRVDRVHNTTKHGKMPLRSRRLVCFGCNRKSTLRYDGSIRKWACAGCESVNYLDEVRWEPFIPSFVLRPQRNF